MKNILKKGSKFFLTALVILNSMMNTIPVHAEETTTDENLDSIVELGNIKDVFPDLVPQDNGCSNTGYDRYWWPLCHDSYKQSIWI